MFYPFLSCFLCDVEAFPKSALTFFNISEDAKPDEKEEKDPNSAGRFLYCFFAACLIREILHIDS